MRIDRATDALAEELGRHPTDRDRGTPWRHGRGRARRNRGHSRPEHAVARLPSSQEEGSLTLVETLGVTEPGYDRVEAEQRPPGPSSTTASGECCACGSSTR